MYHRVVIVALKQLNDTAQGRIDLIFLDLCYFIIVLADFQEFCFISS